MKEAGLEAVHVPTHKVEHGDRIAYVSILITLLPMSSNLLLCYHHAVGEALCAHEGVGEVQPRKMAGLVVDRLQVRIYAILFLGLFLF